LSALEPELEEPSLLSEDEAPLDASPLDGVVVELSDDVRAPELESFDESLPAAASWLKETASAPERITGRSRFIYVSWVGMACLGCPLAGHPAPSQASCP
jgi:hypothetical protein